MTIEVMVKKRDPVTVASLSMKGPFSLMGEAFGRLFGWIGGNGYVPALALRQGFTTAIRIRWPLRSCCGTYIAP